MQIEIKLPLIVCVKNVGTTFMSNNITTTSRTKHIYLRYKYDNTYVEKEVIKIIFSTHKIGTL